MVDTTIDIGTDVAHLALFHPDDLAHRANDPIAWYGYSFAYRAESAAGRLVAWCTGSDGGYRVRFTDRDLSAEEQEAACPGWPFPLHVLHGRILLDNTDALPGEALMTPAERIPPGNWIELPNGIYRAIVTPIDRSGNRELADYVVRFEPVPTLDGIAVAAAPPDLRPFKDWQQDAGTPMETEARYDWPKAPETLTSLHGLTVKGTTLALPGVATSLRIRPSVAELAFPDGPARWDDTPFVLATALAPGQLAVWTRRSGLSQEPDALPLLTLSGRALVRITAVRPGGVVPEIDVEALPAPSSDLPPEAATAFREHVTSAISEGRLAVSSFERERFGSFETPAALTGWALQHLPMPLDRRLHLLGEAMADRIAEIERLLAR
jgi:hypothetical protein